MTGTALLCLFSCCACTLTNKPAIIAKITSRAIPSGLKYDLLADDMSLL